MSKRLKVLLNNGAKVGLTASLCLAVSISAASAKGGTAKPPAGGGGGGVVAPNLPSNPVPPAPPAVAAPVFTVPNGANTQGFSVVGFIQNATVSGARCPAGTAASQFGGTVTINGITMTVPCNTIFQFPAATFTWADAFDPAKVTTTAASLRPITLPASGTTFGGATNFAYPSTEIRVEGNIVGGEYIAGLIYVSQQSLNSGTGYVVGFDYANGAMYIGNSPTGARQVRIQINDPNGRFSKGQSPDTRFSVDDQNPTIKSATGYPMCVPRATPAAAGAPEADPLCPQRNRPLVANTCRNFSAAGVISPAGWELAPPAAGTTYCSAFVMPDPALATATQPISTQQVPFEIGDFITYSGTVLRGSADGPVLNGVATDTISVHTIEANVGIFTQPGTLPVYIALGQFGVGADAPLSFNGIRQESQNRLIVEANVTDVTSTVDVYLVDLDPATGAESQRWITPFSMTGTNAAGIRAANGNLVDGGIQTQFVGPQPGRARIRATKANPGILVSPTRYVRVTARSSCDPTNINGTAAPIGTNGKPIAGAAAVNCLDRAVYANSLRTGPYLAPTFEYIFPENVVAGDPTVPNNFWALGFLVNGEGPGTGPLTPKPW